MLDFAYSHIGFTNIRANTREAQRASRRTDFLIISPAGMVSSGVAMQSLTIAVGARRAGC